MLTRLYAYIFISKSPRWSFIPIREPAQPRVKILQISLWSTGGKW